MSREIQPLPACPAHHSQDLGAVLVSPPSQRKFQTSPGECSLPRIEPCLPYTPNQCSPVSFPKPSR